MIALDRQARNERLGVVPATLLGVVPIVLFVADWVFLADPLRGIQSVFPGLAMLVLALLYPGWVAILGIASARPWLTLILAVLPAILLVPVVLAEPVQPGPDGAPRGLADVALLRGLPLVVFGLWTLVSARVAARVLRRRTTARVVAAFVASGAVMVLGLYLDSLVVFFM